MFEKYYRIKQAAGLSIRVTQNGDFRLELCRITVSDNQLSIKKGADSVNSLHDVKKWVDKRTCMAVNITGKGVLYKQIPRTELINQDNFSLILPNANIEDFYLQNFISGEYSFVSAIRKSEAEKWISELRNLELEILLLSLGPFAIEMVIGQINIYENDFVIDGHQVSRNDRHEWLAYNFKDNVDSHSNFKLESETIDEKQLLSYAAAFELVLASEIPPIRAEITHINNRLTEIIENNKLKLKIGISLIAIMLVLLLNFCLFNHFNTINEKLSVQLSRLSQSDIDIKDISQRTENNKILLKELAWDGGLSKSFFADQIASLLPDNIILKKIAINPVDVAESRAERNLRFVNRQIQVSGVSDMIIPVNEWIARIKTRAWVKNVQLDNYVYNNELNSGEFAITIFY